MLNKFLLVHRYPHYIIKLWEIFAVAMTVRTSSVIVGARVQFHGTPIVSVHKDSQITIGDDCVVCSRSDMTDLGVNHPVILRTLRAGASIVIGKDTGMSGGSICAAVRVEIGKECLLGANVSISDTDFHPVSPVCRRYNKNPHAINAVAVIIEDNVFVGTGSIILKGVRVGANSVIGAGSVVTKDVPPNSIVAGNPAKFIKNI